MTQEGRARQVLLVSTLAFTVCFAAWMINSVLVTFLVSNRLYPWNEGQIGWLLGAPVLTGATLRLPMGLLADRYGGRIVFAVLMLVAAAPMYLLSYADSYLTFLLASLGFGLCGSSFAVGVAYTSLWFSRERQGTALGVFGMGNLGAGLTVLFAPRVLDAVTSQGAQLEAWRLLPRLYAVLLVGTTVLFWLLTYTKMVPSGQGLRMAQRFAPLRSVRVWRFGLYYFFVFGGFVAVTQWLVPFYVSVYFLPLATAGLLGAMFSLPAGVIRAFGGWASDRWGARSVLYLVFGGSIVLLVLLFPPRMEVRAPGQGVLADQDGVVTAVTEREIVIGRDRYVLSQSQGFSKESTQIRFGIHTVVDEEGFLLWPTASTRQVPVVEPGATVKKGQLLARGETHIYFQANVWIFTGLVFLLGILMGLGGGAVYKHIPHYFPDSVGVVGGLVGVIGALGGFVSPILFGYLLELTGVWTTCWMFLAVVAAVCLVWMHRVVRAMMRAQGVNSLGRQIEAAPGGGLREQQASESPE